MTTTVTSMTRWWPVAAAIVACLIAHWTDRLPGDLAIARAVQSIVPGPEWAVAVTGTVAVPKLFVLMAISIALCWWRGGLRAALVVGATLGLVWLIGEPIKALVQRPRPTADLVTVVGTPHGFGFPSTFGTMWGACWLPVVLYTWRRQTPLDTALAMAATVALLVGATARVTLGAHWPSDLLGAYLIALAGWTLVDGVASALRRR